MKKITESKYYMYSFILYEYEYLYLLYMVSIKWKSINFNEIIRKIKKKMFAFLYICEVYGAAPHMFHLVFLQKKNI